MLRQIVVGAVIACLECHAAPTVLAAKPTGNAECRWAAAPIKIDGKGTDAAWKNAEVIDQFNCPWANRKAKTATHARLLWDDKYLYCFADMEDHDLYADVKEHNGLTYNNDVFEMFFKPAADKLGYYEFEVTPLNTTMEMFLPSRGAGGYGRFAHAGHFHWETAVHLRGTLNDWHDRDDGWSVEGRLPWQDFSPTGGAPRPGDKWRFALCRVDFSVDFEEPEYSTTAPLKQINFHAYEEYGELTFVGPKQ